MTSSTSPTDLPPPHVRTGAPGRGGRALSGLEFVFGAAIVLGHNIWRVLPNEVPILFSLALVSAKLREGGWQELGLRRPRSWPRTWAIAAAAALVRILVGSLALDPLSARFWPPSHSPAMAGRVPHHPLAALSALAVVWTFAAFGEEVSYRGYLTRRAAESGAGTRVAWAAATIAVSILFGYGHYYKGPAGVLDSGFAGLVLGATYLATGGNLWAPILAHGLIDTISVVFLFLGWAN